MQVDDVMNRLMEDGADAHYVIVGAQRSVDIPKIEKLGTLYIYPHKLMLLPTQANVISVRCARFAEQRKPPRANCKDYDIN